GGRTRRTGGARPRIAYRRWSASAAVAGVPPPPGRLRSPRLLCRGCAPGRARPRDRSRWSRRPHVEEIEPLGGIAADDLLEETDPAARGRFLLSTLDDDGPTDLDAVPMARTEHAECRDDGNAGRARQHGRPARERGLAPAARRRDEVAEAHGEVPEHVPAERVESLAGCAGDEFERPHDRDPLGAHEPGRQASQRARHREPDGTRNEPDRLGAPVEARAIVPVVIPA